MSSYVSIKSKVLSFVAMCAVLIIHNNTAGENASNWNVMFQWAFSRLATSWAVPFFFLVSGFWAFKMTNAVFDGYGRMMAKKVKTLLVPYVLWVVIAGLIGLPLVMFNNHVTHRPLFDRTFLGYCGVWGKIDALWGITQLGPRGNMALWFVRSLFIIFLAFPLWSLLGKLSKWLWVLVGFVCALGFPMVMIPGLEVRLGSIGWFLLGLAVAKFSLAERHIPVWIPGVTMVGSLFLIIFFAMEHAGYLVLPEWTVRFTVLIQPLGMLFWAGLFDCIWKEEYTIPDFFGMTFWIYCLHEVVSAYFRGAGLYLLGKSDSVTIMLALVCPVITLIVCIFAGRFVQKLLPKTYGVLTGER